MKTYYAIGLMSGSSLDGLDIAYCKFEGEGVNWKYEILETELVPYQTKWRLRLANLTLQNAITYIKTHTFYGHFLGKIVAHFIEEKGIADQLDFICSHGQTIFHQPENNLTSQIGEGAAIAAETGFPVICNFRQTDVALGGQGTPIVPIGDMMLFKEFSHCLNLGGIVNLSYKSEGSKIVGFDTCAGNMILDHLAEARELAYDEDGKLAASGQLNHELLEELNRSWYYEKDYPKSLSGGWVSKVNRPVYAHHNIPVEDKLHTACVHIAQQVGRDIALVYQKEGQKKRDSDRMLVTGGGGLNTFLVEQLRKYAGIEVVVPDRQIVQFKEAVVMALMGVLRVEGQNNVLACVTGSSQDSCGGSVIQGTRKRIKA